MKKVFYNGKVYVEKGVYAQAFLVEDGMIERVGTDEAVLAAAEAGGMDFEKVDCGGRTIIPGLNDSHMHLFMFGRNLAKAKTDDVKSIDEMIQRCRDFITMLPFGSVTT